MSVGRARVRSCNRAGEVGVTWVERECGFLLCQALTAQRPPICRGGCLYILKGSGQDEQAAEVSEIWGVSAEEFPHLSVNNTFARILGQASG